MEREAAAAGAGAPALAEALLPAVQVWTLVCAGRSLESALESALPRATPPALRGAVRDLASATVRRWAMVQALLAALARRPPDPPVAALLGVALAQLLARSYSEFTLVDQAVHAARLHPATASAGGFINAILRQFLRQRAALEARLALDPLTRFNLPRWWFDRVSAQYGAGAASFLAAQLEEPPLVLRVNCRRGTVTGYLAQLAAAGIEASRVGSAAVWIHHAMPVEKIPGFAAGAVSVQDAGAQLAAPLLAPQDGMRVLDACAAPGGKTGHLLEISGCRVDAVELSAQRAQRIDANLRRLEMADRARVLVADACDTGAYWDGEPYARILLDAPCTGSGVVRRHPDILMLRQPADVAKLATLQAEMLRRLWPLLAPTGRLLYVVCSVFAEEGRRQVSAFLRRQPGAQLVALRDREPGDLQLLPSTVRTDAPVASDLSVPVLHDGFFYALLEKT